MERGDLEDTNMILFGIYINDLPDIAESPTYYLFADDTKNLQREQHAIRQRNSTRKPKLKLEDWSKMQILKCYSENANIHDNKQRDHETKKYKLKRCAAGLWHGFNGVRYS